MRASFAWTIVALLFVAGALAVGLPGCGGPDKSYCEENPHAPSCSALYVP
jgi:hypothetical protein